MRSTSLLNPDGYRCFESATGLPEGTRLSEQDIGRETIEPAET